MAPTNNNDDNSGPGKKKPNPWGASEPRRGPWTPNNGGGNGSNNRPGPQGPDQSDLDDILRKIQSGFQNTFSGGDGSNRLIVIGILAVFVLWLASGFYFIQSNQHGVVLTFGKYTKTDVQPGLKYRMPWPFQSATIVDVTQERRLAIGFSQQQQIARGQQVTNPAQRLEDESLMLTGDENIIDINFVVLWRINNAKDYLFSIRDPEDTIRLVSSSAMREIIGQTKIQSALTDGRSKVQVDTRVLMQKILDEYKSGITVNNVQLQKVDPPEAVVDAFNEVQRARQDQERAKNQAQAYSNSILPVAKGEASKLLQQAEAYKQEVINRAKGDAARFDAVYAAYQKGKSVTAERMYLETMEEVLKNARTVVLGSSNSTNILPYLPMQNIEKTTKPRSADPIPPTGSSAVSSTAGDQ